MAAPETRLTRNMDLSARYAAAVKQMYDPYNIQEDGFDYDGRRMGHHGGGPQPGSRNRHF